MAGFGEQKKKKKSTPKGQAQLGGEGLLKTAVDHHTRGDLVNAEKAYRAAIKAGYMHPATFSNLGVICKNSERTEEAILLYKKAIGVSPSDPNAYTNLGNIYKDLGQLDQALAASLKSLELKPDDPIVHINVGGIYKELGQLDQALEATLKSLELKADNPDAQMNLGGIYKELGQLDQALEATLKSLELKADNPDALMNLGGIYKELGQLDQALAATMKSLELKPDNPNALMNLGGIYKELGQLDHALAATLKSLELKPDDPMAHMNLGQIYKELGQLDQALASILKSLKLKPGNPTAFMNLGQIYKELGQLDQALASTLKSLELRPDNPDTLINLGSIYKELGQLDHALASTLKSLELKPDNPDALINLGSSYIELGQLDHALASTLKSLELRPDNPDALINLGSIYKELGQLDHALASTLKSLELRPDNPDALINLGSIYKELGQRDHALASTLKSLELRPDNPTAFMNLGQIYKELGQLDHALALTLKSLELKPHNPDAHMNQGSIYKELGQLDQALAATLKSLELKPDNPGALNNLKGFIDQLTLNSANAQSLMKAYELLINLEVISHLKLSCIFTQIFLRNIQEASKFDPIISVDNNALTSLAADWCLRKSLTLLIPPHQDIEHFLMRLRKELLILAANQKPIKGNLIELTEALATQCFLNEYVYEQSPEEEKLVKQLIGSASSNQEAFDQYLAIVACYTPLHQLDLNKEWLESYPNASHESKALIQSQLEEPREEKRIKASIQGDWEIADSVSLKVQVMYEDNPYPRYRYADFTDQSLAKNISKIIGIESTKKNLQFSQALVANNSRPKVLIAGCGTGNQVITSSRYKNAQITAIDLSSSSLAYAIRKAKDYGMENVEFRKIDLLNVAALGEIFDTIECGGVLHHMKDPAKGLSALSKQLKPGGYIKLGLYSDIARQDIVIARKLIKQRGLKSSADSIRGFRQQVLKGEFKDLENLPSFGIDFYSLSMCWDLCFHVQETRYTTGLLQQLLAVEGLIFCGFIVPEAIRSNYQQQFPR